MEINLNENREIREAMLKKGIKQYMLARALNCEETTLSKKLRDPMSEEEKLKILQVISDIQIKMKTED